MEEGAEQVQGVEHTARSALCNIYELNKIAVMPSVTAVNTVNIEQFMSSTVHSGLLR